jgi:hypothetical protein
MLMKRRAFSIVGAIIALFGLVWLLQGASILPGNVMSGSQFWEVAGAITFIVGLVIIPYSLKK